MEVLVWLVAKMPLREAHAHQLRVEVSKGGLSSTQPALPPWKAGNPRWAPWPLLRNFCGGMLLRGGVVVLTRGPHPMQFPHWPRSAPSSQEPRVPFLRPQKG